MMNSLKFGERRGALRYPLARLAKIKMGGGLAPRHCLITDTSEGGVRVYTVGFEVPDEFVLLLSGDGPAQNGRYKVVWRVGDEVGAKFVGAV